MQGRIDDNCDIVSPEFGWSVKNIRMRRTNAESEYFMMHSENLLFEDVNFKGKYSFQYIENALFDNCRLIQRMHSGMRKM